MKSRVREHRLRLGLTQEALAQKAGLSGTAVRQIEQGARLDPRISTLAALARVLGVRIEELLDGEAPAPGYESPAAGVR